MTTMNISLPEEMKAFVEAQMARDGFASASEYLRALIREDQKRRARRELEAKLESMRSSWSWRIGDAIVRNARKPLRLVRSRGR